MNEVHFVLGVVAGAAVGVLCHQFYIHKKLNNIELICWEVYEAVDKMVQEEVDEKFKDIVERFDED